MPRKPKAIHPLRLLRNALGLNQAELATRLGISEGWVNTIESEGRDLPDKLHVLIKAKYGVDLRRYLPCDPDDAKTIVATVTSIYLSVLSWSPLSEAVNSEALDAFDEVLSEKLRALIFAAQKHGRAISVLALLDLWIDETLQQLGPAVASTYQNLAKSHLAQIGYITPPLGGTPLQLGAHMNVIRSGAMLKSFEDALAGPVPQQFIKLAKAAGRETQGMSFREFLEAGTHEPAYAPKPEEPKSYPVSEQEFQQMTMRQEAAKRKEAEKERVPPPKMRHSDSSSGRSKES